MSKWIHAGIGIAVMVLALTIILGINHQKNSGTIEALKAEPVASVMGTSEESMAVITEAETEAPAGPVTDGVVYVVKNNLHPGMDEQEITAAMESSSAGETAVAEPEEEFFQAGDETITWNGGTYKRNAAVKADLLIGVDNYGSADFLAVAAHDTSRNTLKVLMIPRDAMMEMYATDAQGNVTPIVTHIKFAHAGQGTPAEKAERTRNAVEILLLDTSIDHYMSGGIPLLARINDLVGGVTVTVPNDELQKVNPAWKKGEQIVLHGEEAEQFIRFRDISIAGTPVRRMDQHKAFIDGFFNRLREDGSLTGKIADFVEKNMATDMSKGEYERLLIDGLSCGFDPQKDILTLPGMVTVGKEGGGTYDQYYADYEEAIPVLLGLFYRKIS